MEMRNLRRHMLFDRALYKHNKKHGTNHTSNSITALVWIHEVSGIPRTRLFQTFAKVRRAITYVAVCKIVTSQIQSGLIRDEEGRLYINPSGLMVLMDIERRLRLERYDK